MTTPPQRALGLLERRREEVGPAATAEKRALLRELLRARLRTPAAVLRLHEVLCFLRAYPDDARLLAEVERALSAFARRADLRAHRAALADSGVAGTDIRYPFFHPTARWLAGRWPRLLALDRDDEQAGVNLQDALPVLATPLEAAALRALKLPGYEALDRLRPRGATDATFLVNRVEARWQDDFTREAFYDALNPTCVLAAGRDTPARSREKLAAAPVAFSGAPRARGRPDLAAELRRPPRAVRALPARDARALIDLARGAMVARGRDFDSFAYGNPRDCWLADDGGGLSFGFIGVRPERRVLLPAVYGSLTLRNGVPIGYGQADVLGAGAALSFNTFATFRGGAAAGDFARWLAALRALLGVSSFSAEPYQLGEGNEEGIASAAWWFYAKLGFRPRAPEARRLARAELARWRADPRHRSRPAVLRRLARAHLFFDLDPARPAPLAPLPELGLWLAQRLGRHGPDRETALADLAARALQLSGLTRSASRFTRDERRAWERFGPLLALLPAFARWSPAQRRAAAEVLRAKGARSERTFAARWSAHPKLERALFAAARNVQARSG
jgi:hypothetical protein